MRWFTLLILVSPTLAQTEIVQLQGAAPGDEFGASIAFVGDLDGDGLSDLAVGAPGADPNGANTGQVRVFSAGSLQVIRTLNGLAGKLGYGRAIASVGDIDGDTVDDFLISSHAPWPYTGAYVHLISGATGGVARTFDAPAGIANYGAALAGGPDLDGDQIGDLLIGAPREDLAGGYVYVYSGADGSKIRRDGVPSARNLGTALVSLGDVNGSGIDDYAAGASDFYGWWGSVYLLEGGDGSVIWEASGNVGHQFGWSLANVGDQDGDGLDDLLVGETSDQDLWGTIFCGAAPKSAIEVVSGADGSQIREHLESFKNCTAYGYSVTGTGDLNGDGLQEYVGGEPGWILGSDSAYDLRVYDGATGVLVATVVNPASGLTNNAWGVALTAGDATADGLIDLVVGASHDDTGGVDAGLVSIQTIVRTPTAYCQAQINSQSCTPTIFATGVPSIAGNNFRVKASNVVNNKTGLLFWGVAPKQAQFGGGFHKGYKCVVSPTRRTPLQDSGGNPPPDDCSGLFSFHWNGSYLASVGLSAGEEVFCQFWSRDPQAIWTNTNLTDALAFFLEP